MLKNRQTSQARKRSNRRYYEKRRAVTRDAKDVLCADCSMRYPWYVMDFDHVRGKSFTIGGNHQRRGIKSIQDEIEKCDVVCANCHRIRTYRRASVPQLVDGSGSESDN